MPITTETMMPMGMGASWVALLIKLPSQVMNAEMPGPTNCPARPPATSVASGTSTMSTGVLPATKLPISAPTTAAI